MSGSILQVVYFVMSFLSFQLLHPVRLPVCFVATCLFRLLLPLVSTLAIRSLLLPFRFNSFLPFATSLLSFQLFPFIRYSLPFVIFRFNASRSFTSSFRFRRSISLHPSFRFNSYIPHHGRLEKMRFAGKAFFSQF